MLVGSVKNHRMREKGILVYPVHSRRSGGLSVGINLFPDKKCCNFDCPYCEAFPFSTNAVFSPDQMEEDLRAVIEEAFIRKEPIRDICFSGNGEPTMSPDFPEALERVSRIREKMIPSSKLVLITNGTGLLDPELFSLLQDAIFSLDLDIWLKLDAGTPGWFETMNRSSVSFGKIVTRIKEFTSSAPVTIQTMLCMVDGNGPPPGEAEAWEKLVLEIAHNAGAGGRLKVQLYGKARPAPEDPKAGELPMEYLEGRARSLRVALEGKMPVEVFK